MSQALYRKYRPKSWAEVIGQEHVVQTLQHAIASDRLGHAYLFAGPRGTGKTTLARILAKAANCTADDPRARPCNECNPCKAVNENRFLDLIEMDAASNTGVEDVRDLRDKINFSPNEGKYKIYIIDEVHMLSTQAFNALLKTLEEPPPHAIFILATTEIQKIPATVLSRCQRHEFRRVPLELLVANLQQIVKTEDLKAEEDALRLIARQATGSVRDAQSLLDQLASVGTPITLELTQKVLGTATSEAVLDLIGAIKDGETGVGLEVLQRTLDSGVDARTLARQLVEYLRGLLLIQMGSGDQVEATREVRQRMTADAAALATPRVLRTMKGFNAAAVDTRGGWQPSLSLEVALVEAFETQTAAVDKESGSSGGGGASAVRAPSAAAPQDRPKPPVRALEPGTRANAIRAGDMLYQEAGSTATVQGALPQAETPKNSGALPEANAAPTAGLAQVLNAWKDVRAAIKPAHPSIEALLNSCKPVDVRGDVLLLGFQSETVRALMDKPENLDVTRKAIAEVLGSQMKIKCVVVNARGKLPPNVSQDGMVATALNQGGEIVDVQD
jgi:DNA polymerase-3 subunit gamma/tau